MSDLQNQTTTEPQQSATRTCDAKIRSGRHFGRACPAIDYSPAKRQNLCGSHAPLARDAKLGSGPSWSDDDVFTPRETTCATPGHDARLAYTYVGGVPRCLECAQAVAA